MAFNSLFGILRIFETVAFDPERFQLPFRDSVLDKDNKVKLVIGAFNSLFGIPLR